MFDSLKYAKILEDAGLPRDHAETHIKVLSEVIGGEVVTREVLKTSLGLLRTDLSGEIADVRAELKAEIAELRAELKTEIAAIRTEFKAETAEIKVEIAELRTEITELKLQFANFRKEIDLRFVQMENRIVVKLGGLMTALFSIALTASQLLN